MEVKPLRQGSVQAGYKQTEVGVIPEDWGSSKIGDYAFVTKLAGFEYTLHFDYSKSGPITAVRALNIKGGALNLNDVHTIPKETSDALPRSKLHMGDLAISYVGTLGRVAVIPEDNRFHLAPNVAKIAVDRQAISPEFLCHFLNGFQGQKNIFDAAASTTQAALSMRNLRGIFFARPTKAEQEAIAEALSDADVLIESLEQLIAKKRLLKQGVMQELLFGKKRLPGFSGEWEVKRLGALASIQRGASPRPIDSPIWFDENSSVGWVRISDVTKSGMYLLETTQRLSPLGVQHSRAVSRGSMIMSICATVGRPIITKIDTCIHDGFVVFDNLRVDKQFLYYILKFIEDDWSGHGQTGSQMNLNTGLINRTEVSAPQNIAEQTAIAAILSDMDAELVALEDKLAKARGIKQGMMQELLTGRIRLV